MLEIESGLVDLLIVLVISEIVIFPPVGFVIDIHRVGTRVEPITDEFMDDVTCDKGGVADARHIFASNLWIAEVIEEILSELDMKLIDVEYTFDNKKILFYFTADGRVDFRDLVKDLAAVFKTRIELRQIGVRDEAKMVGGLGICGRPLCCSSHLCDFQPVSIKMAKEQGLSLNPTKISGTCGRLMCCLKYEQESHEHLLKITPKVGAVVDTKEGRGTVVDTNLISGQIKVCLDKSPDGIPSTFSRRQVKTIRDGGRVSVSKAEREALKNIEEN